MDRATVGAYDAGAAAFAKDWHEQPAPADLHALIKRFFRPGRTADVGCGSGRAINLMAQAFPASRFSGYDFSEGAIRAARAEAERLGLANASFEVVDVTGLDVEARFDKVTAFDAIHDQAHPAGVLRNIRRALRPDGNFLMVDIKASSKVEENIELP